MVKRHNYRVEVWADFTMLFNSPSSLRKKIIKIIQREGFSETNFDIQVSRVDADVVIGGTAPSSETTSVIIHDPKKKLKGFDKPPKGRGKLSTSKNKPKHRAKRKVRKDSGK